MTKINNAWLTLHMDACVGAYSYFVTETFGT